MRLLVALLCFIPTTFLAVVAEATEARQAESATASVAADNEAGQNAAAVTHEMPPILNFGSLDGYYRVLAGEIGIAGVRRYVCLAFVSTDDEETHSGFSNTEIARDAFFDVATLAQQTPVEPGAKKVTFTEVPFPLNVPFGRKEHLAGILDLDREWVRLHSLKLNFVYCVDL
eukprot:INCI1051.3.p1 GENE.INCI1051.3~~INCI1051.3.p1  ORF type:complete len:172 (-),score=42.81 INCI1051.3:494-1009(-)